MPQFRASCAMLLIFLVAAKCLAGVQYYITDLGPVEPWSINNHGQVVGTSNGAWLYSGGIMTYLLGGTAMARGINDKGDVVGSTGGDGQAFLYTNGVITILPPFPGYSFGGASAINNNGQVAGASYNDFNGYSYGVETVWTYGPITTSVTNSSLGVLPGTSQSGASGINDKGQVVGTSFSPNYGSGGVSYAFLESDGVMTNLGAADGVAINSSGQVVFNDGGSGNAFLYSDGTTINLGSLGGLAYQSSTAAFALNNNGQVVGASVAPLLGYRDDAFRWSNGVMVDLNSLISPGSGWTLTAATGINDRGQIIGYGTTWNSQLEAFLLTPLPVLGIRVSGSNAVLSWPTNAVGFSLLQNSVVTSTNWLPVTNAITVANDQNEVSIPLASAQQQFYRLQLLTN